MLDEDPLLRIEVALRDAAELEARRAEHSGEDHQLREIRQLHRSLMASIGRAEGAQRPRGDNLSDLMDVMDRIVRMETSREKL